MNVPRFADLPTIGSDERHAWDVFGRDDRLGCLNFLTSDRVRAAAATIETGERVSLNLPIGTPARQFWATRGSAAPLEHHVHVTRRGRDDHLDNFYLQGSTQWDGFGHVRYRQHGYYGGRQEYDLDRGALGIEAWAEQGVFGRGVLIDAAGYMTATGDRLDPQVRTAIGADLIERIAAHHRIEIIEGDVLVIRTGWLEWYLALDQPGLDALAAEFDADRTAVGWPGLDASLATTAWLWDHQIAAVAADNATLEAIPYVAEDGWAHHRLLALLGMPLGELWKLDQLAATCERHGRWTFFLSAPPLALPSGIGSPANAYAIF